MWSNFIRSSLISSKLKPKHLLKINENSIRKTLKNNFKSVIKNRKITQQQSFTEQSSQNAPNASKLVLKYGFFSLAVFGTCFTISPIIVYERMVQQQKSQRIQIILKKYSDIRLKVKKMQLYDLKRIIYHKFFQKFFKN